MIDNSYHSQVKLLLRILPEVAKEKCFALHGGTAINLFVCDMPRLSVDIDLTYIQFESREIALEKINEGIAAIKFRLEKLLTDTQVEHKRDICKLLVSSKHALVKLEVNSINRGVLSPPSKLSLCQKAQDEYQAFVVANVVPLSQLYGGKICAALVRQHPRDLFDVKWLLANKGISREIFVGFLHALLSNERPMHEILSPHILDQKHALKHQFNGMTAQVFSYNEFEDTRSELIDLVNRLLTDGDKEFLLSISKLTPQWEIHDFSKFPSILWKLSNLGKLREKNPQKYRKQFEDLSKTLGIDESKYSYLP